MEPTMLKISALEGPFADCSSLCSVPMALQLQPDTPMLGGALRLNTSCLCGRSQEQRQGLFDALALRGKPEPLCPGHLPRLCSSGKEGSRSQAPLCSRPKLE